MSDTFEIRSVLREGTAKDGKTNNGKFLVEWKPSFASKSDLDGASWQDFERRGPADQARVLGPINSKNMKTVFGCKWAVKFPKHTEEMSYETLVDHFPHLLIAYYEKKVRLVSNKENEKSDDEA
uniref:Chromo shadow domain-containing protein n=1 Tax=Panagrolaimus sp. JU765 TaxID=591449 RepID=A0AC34R8I8_9BILA